MCFLTDIFFTGCFVKCFMPVLIKPICMLFEIKKILYEIKFMNNREKI